MRDVCVCALSIYPHHPAGLLAPLEVLDVPQKKPQPMKGREEKKPEKARD